MRRLDVPPETSAGPTSAPHDQLVVDTSRLIAEMTREIRALKIETPGNPRIEELRGKIEALQIKMDQALNPWGLN
ncbi:hypothetical protein IPJ72_03935 [Candidatus Peregrinibacteria bacterium]|nr:MAG: hypothetical protein IPJ72_03935 [Candidatus Peregrinibacteria bacterium]